MSMYEIEGVSNKALGGVYTFRINNTFYLLSPPYYVPFYNNYLRIYLQIYDGYVPTWHNLAKGLTPNRLAQSVNKGLFNILFAHGIDFSGNNDYDYSFARKWAEKVDLYGKIRKACLYSGAGGTALLAIDRKGRDLTVSAHRIDTFYPDIDSDGNIVGAKIYFDLFDDVQGENVHHYGICEERYFNDEGIPCVKRAVYLASGNIETATLSRPTSADGGIKWEQLPRAIKRHIKANYPDILIGKEQYLPFADSLGLFLIKYTDSIPNIPNSQFGQPLSDIIRDECFQFDQLKCFEKNEVYLAKGRVLLPEEMLNKDDPARQIDDFDEPLFEKLNTLNNDNDKPTPLQFMLRASDIRTQKENIYRDIAAKLNVSASTIASFLSEGAGARTATEIINEKTKTDSWIPTQIRLISPAINQLLSKVMRYYDHEPVTIVFKSQAQAPTLETAKTYTDMYSQGVISPRLYVSRVFPDLTEEQQKKEIERLEALEQLKKMQVTPQSGSNLK